MLNMTEFKKQFIDSCRHELSARGASCYEIEEHSVNKAQRGELNGLLFRRPGSNCVPTLYVEDFYDMYRHGTSMNKLSRQAVHSVISSRAEADMLEEYSNRDSSCQFEGNLNARLLSKRKNRKLLKTVPYRDLGCGLVLIADWVYGDFRAMITNELLCQTGLSRKQLFDDALTSMSAREPAVLCRLDDAVMQLSGSPATEHNLLEALGQNGIITKGTKARGCSASDLCVDTTSAKSTDIDADAEVEAAADQGNSALVLSNSSMYWGAAALFYPGVVEKIHAVLNDDYYIIPSSVHELIIVPASGADPDALTALLRSANREVVEEAEVLDDDIYICKNGHVTAIQKTLPR